jgi:hypothetical protein
LQLERIGECSAACAGGKGFAQQEIAVARQEVQRCTAGGERTKGGQ